MIRGFLFPALLFCTLTALYGQGEKGRALSELFLIPDFSVVTLAEEPGGAAESAPKELPLWVKDLRRAEIVAFGTIPFTIFFSSFFVDLYRAGTHNWDGAYMPWPLKGAGAAAMTDNELKAMFTIAVSASLTLALTDHIIMRIKRHRGGKRNSPVKTE
ncbi:MAG: hypothetical protein LBQ44_03700 [Treponema sp.]|jgi:hypothetical protein|nr:hypothetical protein [Treponema sp.]